MLDEGTSLPPMEICQSTKLCLRSTYFQFEESFYEQREGATMGSPLSPVIANIFVENLEERVLNTAILRPSVSFRYVHVDDTFVTWTHGDTALRKFHQHLNQQSSSIQFTMEEEKDDQLLFLDVLVSWAKEKLRTSVYRKPTHTDRYINSNSHHHSGVFRGTILCLRDRAYNVCDETSRTAELKHLHKSLLKRISYSFDKRNPQKKAKIQHIGAATSSPGYTRGQTEKNTCSFLIFGV